MNKCPILLFSLRFIGLHTIFYRPPAFDCVDFLARWQRREGSEGLLDQFLERLQVAAPRPAQPVAQRALSHGRIVAGGGLGVDVAQSHLQPPGACALELGSMQAVHGLDLRGVPAGGVLAHAPHYMDSYWPKLVRYVERGDLPIDNNRAENAIRLFVVGRKNWLFSNTQAGAHASAVLYSLLETAKANGREPYLWLRHVLERLPVARTADDFDALLPWNFHPQHSST